jgi:hypothetical protein
MPGSGPIWSTRRGIPGISDHPAARAKEPARDTRTPLGAVRDIDPVLDFSGRETRAALARSGVPQKSSERQYGHQAYVD